MKAYQIMMFVIIFNMSLSIIGALSIYEPPVSVDDTYDVNTYRTANAGENLASTLLGGTFVAVIAGAISGALIGSWVLKIPSSDGAAYGLFATLFWSSFLTASVILFRIGGESKGILIAITVFLLLSGLIFVTGFMQLIRGGFKGMM